MSLTRPLTWFATVTLLGLMMVFVSQTSGSGPLRDVSQEAVSPFENGLHALVSPVADFVTNVGSFGELRQENQRLRAENARLQVQLAQVQEQVSQNQQLAALLRVQQTQPDARFQTAHVVARDPSNLHDQIEINLGTSQGIKPGMSVLGAGGALIGTVRRTLPDRAWVALISDSQSNINAVIQESRALAVARGAVDKHVTLQFLAESFDVKVGDTVLTSGLGGGYPPGLLIGHVASVQGQPVDVFKSVTVEPAVRLDSLENVLVLVTFVPAASGG